MILPQSGASPHTGRRVSVFARMFAPLLLIAVALAQAPPAVAYPRIYLGTEHDLRVELPRMDETIVVDGSLSEAGLAAGGAPHRFLAVLARRRPRGGGRDRSARLVLADGDPLRHQGARGAGHRARHARRSRPHRRRRLRPPDSPRSTTAARRRSSASTRSASSPTARSSKAAATAAAPCSAASRAGARSPTSRPDFVFRVEGPAHRLRLRDRDRDPVQDAALSVRRRVQDWALNVVRRVQSTGHEDSWAPALRASSSFLGAVGHARRPHRSAPRPGARSQSGRDRARRRARRRPAAGTTTPAARSSAATSAGA